MTAQLRELYQDMICKAATGWSRLSPGRWARQGAEKSRAKGPSVRQALGNAQRNETPQPLSVSAQRANRSFGRTVGPLGRHEHWAELVATPCQPVPPRQLS